MPKTPSKAKGTVEAALALKTSKATAEEAGRAAAACVALASQPEVPADLRGRATELARELAGNPSARDEIMARMNALMAQFS